MLFKKYLDISTEVQDALDNKKPIVALESTIISHGMPYPQNFNTAKMLEDEVRKNGAIPATIAIINGRIKIGLTTEEIEIVATAEDVKKVSRRDIPTIIVEKENGATTVASTMIFANMAGIKVFATGGIGGVHRGAENSFDVSADLVELSNTNVAVVCAGAKSILDIGLTLEKLETFGVPVIGYGTDEFPAFYTRSSGFGVEKRIDLPETIAKIIKTKWDLGLKGGVLIANPIEEAYEADAAQIDNAISVALEEAKSEKIKGKDVTPFLLKKVKELTEGESLESNIALVRNNASLAAKIAVEYQGQCNN